MSTNPFDYLQFDTNGITSSVPIRGTVASGYQLFMAIGVIGIITTLILVTITAAGTRSPEKRAGALDEIKWKAVVAIVLFSMTTVISWIYGLAMSFA